MIRQGNLDDCGPMADIFNYYVANSTVIFSNRILSAADMVEKLQGVVDGRFPFFVDEAPDGMLIGYCYAHKWHPDAVYGRTWEITIYLRESCRGRGIGIRLLERVVEESRKLGAHVLISCITEGNEPCERMHRRAGFELQGVFREVGYKFDRFLNDAIYLKQL